MVLATHALVGAAAASVLPQHPVIAFTAGFVSHFVIDAIPHWDYGKYMRSMIEDHENELNNDFVLGKDFVRDFSIIAGDGIAGIILSFAIFSGIFSVSPWIVFFGAVGGEIPDALQFLYYKTRLQVMEPLQRFHIWLQRKSPIDVSPLTGIGLQGAFFACVLAFVWLVG